MREFHRRHLAPKITTQGSATALFEQTACGSVRPHAGLIGYVDGEPAGCRWRGELPRWGDEPPFHTPVFVMTHHERPSFTLTDTTFHFVGGDPATVLARALEAADGKDVRLGGGATTVRQFLDAGLVDTLHVSVAPLELGGGTRLWDSPDELLDRSGTTATVVPGREYGVVCTTCSDAD